MELKDYKEPIVIINLIQTLIKSSINSAWWDNELYKKFENDEIDEDHYIELVTYKRNDLIENELNLLDVALIHLKIEDEKKYFKLKEIILDLDENIKFLYSKEVSTYPRTPPNIISKHVAELQNFKNEIPISTNNHLAILNEDLIEEVELPNIELSTIPDRVRLLMELGIIRHLETEYPILKGNKNKLTQLLMEFMKVQYSSLQPVVNAIEYDDDHKKKPKLSRKVQNVLNKYKEEK
jgi:hypothetical protein